LVGYNNAGKIMNSYASGTVAGGSSSFVGGLVGTNSNSDGSATMIASSYASGQLSGGGDAAIGGLIGQDLAQTGNGSDYWDLDTSGVSDPSQGAGNVANDPGIAGLSDSQLKSGLPVGFDPSIWAQKSRINGGYPYLINTPPAK
jgi:hypothetical protein